VQLAGEREVKAQVRLRFQNVMGKVTVTRCMQLIQRANGKQEWKSIDSSIQIEPNNKKEVSCCLLLKYI
jgi:hypothetical protein